MFGGGDSGAGFHAKREGTCCVDAVGDAVGETARMSGLGGLLYAFTNCVVACPATCEGELARVLERPLGKTCASVALLMTVAPGLSALGLCQVYWPRLFSTTADPFMVLLVAPMTAGTPLAPRTCKGEPVR